MVEPTDAQLETAREVQPPKSIGGIVFVATGSKRTALDLPYGLYRAAVMNCKRRDGYLHVTLAVSEKAEETETTEGK